MESSEARLKALVVDDDRAVRDCLKRILETMSLDVLVAGDGDEALATLNDGEVNVVITDMIMPNMDGLALLTVLRRDMPSVPVIILTGMPGVDAAVECMRLGAFDYIAKPLDMDQTKVLVTSALQENRAALERACSARYTRLNPGRFFGDYRIVETLGEGSAGIVLLVEKPGDDGAAELYAMKVLKPQLPSDEDPILAERFRREAKVASMLDHENIIRIVEYGVTPADAMPFLVMQYFEGRTLKEREQEADSLDFEAKQHILRQVAAALVAIHDAGICHRDVKPHNILLNDQMQIKLTDFGIAHLPESNLTMTSELLGSPAYLAPEAFSSSRVDARSDIFSLGVVAYELFLGVKPFQGKDISHFAHLVQHDRPVEPRHIDPGFPPELQDILARMLKKKPADRYASTRQVLADLQAFEEAGSKVSRFISKARRRLARDWRAPRQGDVLTAE